jgi:hypothetical protein
MVAEQPLPMPMPPDAVVRVGAQTGFELDDVAIETAAGGFALCQVKARLALGEPQTSPLADALDQVVAQFLAGAGGRPVIPGRDTLVIVTDARAHRTVRSHLATAISRSATQPAGTPFGHGLTGTEARALSVALVHIRRSWSARDRVPTDEDLRRLLSAVAVVTVDTVDGGRERATAQATIRCFVSLGEERRAWDALVAVGREVAIAREWRSRPELVSACIRRGVMIGPGPSAARDIVLLRAATQSNLAALQADTTLPVGGGMHLSRLADADLAAAGPADGDVLVVGEAGSGKTGALVTLASVRSECGQDVVVLRAIDLAAGTVSGNTRLTLPIDQVLLSWTGVSPATLVIDALDAARGSTARTRLAELVGALAESRWQVAASVRTFDLLYGPALRAAFPGEPVSSGPARRDSRLDGIRYIRLGDLTEAELDPLITSATPVAGFYAAAAAELQALMRNPFNLRLAAELLAPGAAISRLARQRLTSARTRLDLLAAYWEHRVDQDDDAIARTDLLTRIAEDMLRSRQLRALAAAPTVEAIHSGALRGLLSDNVLAEEDRSGTAARRVLVFSHHILFDYTSMRCVLRHPLDELQLLQRLDVDPALPLVARPSLDMLFDDLWQAAGDRHSYWQLVLALAASPHLLASLPAAARLAAAGPSAEDLLPLTGACTDPRPDRRRSGYTFLSQINGALRASVTPEAAVTATTVALARLAADLSDTAKMTTPTWQSLGAVADLLSALQLRRPLISGQPGAADRARAVVNVLDACRADAVQFERLAIAVINHLKGAIAADGTQADAVTRLLDDANAVSQWGGRVLALLVITIPELARTDTALARRTADAAWTFQEVRDESVDLGSGPLLPITISRGQEAEHARWQLGDIFPELCRDHLLTAAAIFADIVDAGLLSGGQTRGAVLWPLTFGDARGWLASDGPDVETIGGEAILAMAQAVRDALADAGAHGAEPGPVMTWLVNNMHNASAWAALLTPAVNTDGLAAAALPLLTTGSLLAHLETHEAAGGLLRALAAHADDKLHTSLEAAVRAAGERATSAGRPRPQHIVDELLGCLDPARVTGDAERSRLASLAHSGGAPPLTPRPQVTAWFAGRETLLERLTDRGPTVGTSLATAVGALDEAVALVGAGGASETTQAARQQIPDLFLKADKAGAANPAAPTPVRLLMTQAAAMLAHDVDLVPGTPLARRVVDVLLRAATSNDAGRMLP